MGLLKVGEVASALRVSPQTVRRIIADGTLPAVSVGKQLRVDAGEFVRYLRRNEAESADAAVATRSVVDSDDENVAEVAEQSGE